MVDHQQSGWNFDDFNLDEVDPENCESNVYIEKAGRYHFQIEDVIPEPEPVDKNGNDRTPRARVILAVLKTAEGQDARGSKLFHDLYLGQKGGGAPDVNKVEAICKFLYALELIEKDPTSGKFVDAETGGSQIEAAKLIPKLIGRQFIGHVKFDRGSKDGKFKPKLGLHFGNGCFRLTDPRINNVPVSEADLTQAHKKARAGEAESLKEESSGKAGEFSDI